MTIQQAELLLQGTGITIAFQHRFAFDSGTILRLDNDAMINLFDDGRYFIQGDNLAELRAAFAKVEAPWDPETWSGEVPRRIPMGSFPFPASVNRFET